MFLPKCGHSGTAVKKNLVSVIPFHFFSLLFKHLLLEGIPNAKSKEQIETQASIFFLIHYFVLHYFDHDGILKLSNGFLNLVLVLQGGLHQTFTPKHSL